jgi:hypothetical protein
MNTAERVFHAAQKLSRELETIPGIPLPPAVVGADPTDYCADYFRAYLDRAASGRRPCLIVGMNPSPHGQAQNGVPFGDTPTVRRILADYVKRCGDCLSPPMVRPDMDNSYKHVWGPDEDAGPLLTVDGLGAALRVARRGHRALPADQLLPAGVARRGRTQRHAVDLAADGGASARHGGRL